MSLLRAGLIWLGMLVLTACGGGSSPPPGPVVTNFEPQSLASEVRTPFVIEGVGLAPEGTEFAIELRADVGTPFAGGTMGVLRMQGMLGPDGTVNGTTPACGLTGSATYATVAVELAGGDFVVSVPGLVRIDPPFVESIDRMEVVSSARPSFVVTGSGFGPVGGEVTLTFPAVSGVPFDWGRSDRLTAIARVESPTSIAGTVPWAKLVSTRTIRELGVAFASGGAARLSFPDAPLKFSAPESLRGQETVGGDGVGTAVAIDGDTLVVGAPNWRYGPTWQAGAVFVYVRRQGAWELEALLRASDPVQYARFGSAVAVSGDTVLIGAHQRDAGLGKLRVGAAYVFVREDGKWTQMQRLDPFGYPAARGYEYFGTSVALDGEAAVVGAPQYDGTTYDGGGLFLFERVGGRWVEDVVLTGGAGNGDRLGSSVALEGGTLVAGAPRATGGGAAHVFHRSDGTWVYGARLEPDYLGAKGGTGFGTAVALSGETVLVGHPYDTENGLYAGAVYLFERGAGAWSDRRKLLPRDGSESDRFGQSVALRGGKAMIGAPWAQDRTPPIGGVYLFEQAGQDWKEVVRLAPPGVPSAVRNDFGAAVALGEDALVVGEPLDDTGASLNRGAAHVY